MQQQNSGVQKWSYNKHQEFNKLWDYISLKGVPYSLLVKNREHVKGRHPFMLKTTLVSQSNLSLGTIAAGKVKFSQNLSHGLHSPTLPDHSPALIPG